MYNEPVIDTSLSLVICPLLAVHNPPTPPLLKAYDDVML